jgi:hypothetical protein
MVGSAKIHSMSVNGKKNVIRGLKFGKSKSYAMAA